MDGHVWIFPHFLFDICWLYIYIYMRSEKGSIDLVSLPDPKDVDYLDAINKSVQLAASLSENGKDNSKAQNDASDFQI